MSAQRKISDLSSDLADRAESFCAHFFPNGRKQGNYWQIGDTSGVAGQSLAVRLQSHGARGVTQVVFKPDWKNHGKAAPFKRNDKMLDTMPQGLIATPGSGITENIVDKARKLGIRVKRIGA